MTKTEKKQFINSLMGAIRFQILAKVPNMPDHWDGHEMRQYIADTVSEQAVFAKMDRKRMASYRNDLLTSNL